MFVFTNRLDNVSLDVVQKAIDDMYASPTMKFLANAGLHQKLFIMSVILRFKATGLSEAVFGEVVKRHLDLCRLHTIDPPTTSDLAYVCAGLGSSRILMVEAAKADLFQKIRLNIPEEDAMMAFRADEFMRRLL
jgi:Cdc6-like AAA superfamily ATPase